MRRGGHVAASLVVAASAVACTLGSPDPGPGPASADPPTAPTAAAVVPVASHDVDRRSADPFAPPEWLGLRPLPLGPDGFGAVLPTPEELRDRRFQGPDVLPAPTDDRFHATISEVPPEVVARSTWSPSCPVALDDLRYLTVGFWGFDGRAHTGELIVHRSVAEPIAEVFGALHEARFPLEELRVIAAEELDAHPTGDGNVSSSFVCRRAVEAGDWSRHAYGLAVDLNPFHNPYVRGDLVIPELASAYVDRTDHRPGMIVAGDEVTRAFAAIGWRWGGSWGSAKDWMHFSDDGR